MDDKLKKFMDEMDRIMSKVMTQPLEEGTFTKPAANSLWAPETQKPLTMDDLTKAMEKLKRIIPEPIYPLFKLIPGGPVKFRGKDGIERLCKWYITTEAGKTLLFDEIERARVEEWIKKDLRKHEEGNNPYSSFLRFGSYSYLFEEEKKNDQRHYEPNPSGQEDQQG